MSITLLEAAKLVQNPLQRLAHRLRFGDGGTEIGLDDLVLVCGYRNRSKNKKDINQNQEAKSGTHPTCIRKEECKEIGEAIAAWH